jgi:hypothetical protein
VPDIQKISHVAMLAARVFHDHQQSYGDDLRATARHYSFVD